MYRGDGVIDTFFEILFVEWEKRNRFAKKCATTMARKARKHNTSSLMLNQVGIDDLCRLVRESVNDCSSLENDTSPSDLEVKEMLLEECNRIIIVSISSSLPKQERDRNIISVLQKGAGIRQLSKLQQLASAS